jgi:protease IV
VLKAVKKLIKLVWKAIAAGWRALTFIRQLAVNVVFLLVIALVAYMIWGGRGTGLPERAVLHLALSGTLVEQRSESLLSNELLGEDVAGETVLQEVVDAIDSAREDDRIKGIHLDVSKLQAASLSKLQDVGAALKRFRRSGKPVIATSHLYTQRGYYLAAHADRVYLDPMGGVLLTGLGIYQNYYKDALDRLQVQIHVFKVGDYKSALDPLLRNDMSDFDRQANSAVLDVLWSAYKQDVAGQRGIEPAAIDDYVNHLPERLRSVDNDTARLALACRLVDALKTADEVRVELIGLAGEDRARQSYNRVRLDDYVKATQAGARRGGVDPKPKVGVIVAQGVILDGTQPAGRIGGDSLAALIRKARKESAMRAIVLRIDSPGGSAFASEAVRRELELARTEDGRTVVVSMGSVAASGGYWIACGADEIWASPTTITGSIGIFSAFSTFERSLQSLGVSNDGVGSTRMADAFNPSRPMNALAAQALDQAMAQGYGVFISRVAEGRRMSAEAVERVAQGRIWAGKDALEIGLVDKLGGLPEAIAAAAAKAGLEVFAVDFLQQPLTRRERLVRELKDLFTAAGGRLVEITRPEQALLLRTLAGKGLPEMAALLKEPSGYYAYCLNCSTN